MGRGSAKKLAPMHEHMKDNCCLSCGVTIVLYRIVLGVIVTAYVVLCDNDEVLLLCVSIDYNRCSRVANIGAGWYSRREYYNVEKNAISTIVAVVLACSFFGGIFCAQA